ncbi:MAG: helicase, partial [Roseiflexus castenholzii]
PPQPAPNERKSMQRIAPSAPETTEPSQPNAVQNDERSETPDAAALIERLRRQREQRERVKGRVTHATSARETEVQPRFVPGDRIFCLPYGDGEVLDSRIEDDREMLTVRFPDYGELVIDPALSLVRKLEPPREN